MARDETSTYQMEMSVVTDFVSLCYSFYALDTAEPPGRTEPVGTQLCVRTEEECDQRAQRWPVIAVIVYIAESFYIQNLFFLYQYYWPTFFKRLPISIILANKLQRQCRSKYQNV